MRNILSFLFSLTISYVTLAQETFPVNGPYNEKDGFYAFTNATIIINPEKKINNGTLLIKKGVIEAAGENISIPKGAIVKDLKGKYIYPSFIDLYSNYGVPSDTKTKRDGRPPMLSTKDGAYHWNQAISPEINASEIFKTNDKQAEKLRAAGFGLTLTHQQDGIARGTGCLATLATDEKENDVLIKEKASANYSFNKGSSIQDYPGSLMGGIALLRQTYIDAEWYKSAKNKAETNLSLEAWNNIQSLPQIFETVDMLDIMRADKIGDEFGKQYIIKGNGDEYKRIDPIKATKAALIIPIKFPKAYDVKDPYDAMNVGIEELKHWETAPANPAILEKADIPFAITYTGSENAKEFFTSLKKAIEYGLSEKAALAALTTTPAKLLNISNEAGTLEKGKLANFIITDNELFHDNNNIIENWIKGKPYILKDDAYEDRRGKYILSVEKMPEYDMVVGGKQGAYDIKININDSTKIKVDYTMGKNLVSLEFQPDKKDKGFIRLSGTINNNGWSGKGQLADGTWVKWSVKLTSKDFEDSTKTKEKDNKKEKPEYSAPVYPFLPFGWTEKPKAKDVLIKNATVWTNEKEGILQNADVLIKGGKIAQVGKNLSASGAEIIDGTGKHLTSGIIDEHSHIAISRGVNECTQAVTAEVSIADVINSEDINIYRQLSGGVTTSQLLHGSCNPVGGRSGIIKLRWGYAPEEMKFEGADGFIKFALGENVKRSNFGDDFRIRYPQTRMGVEQVYDDAFTRAKEYEQVWKRYNALSSKEKAKTIPPRKDIELDVLVEIINSKRFITCHLYVQSEINMLMKVAERYGFKVNTFTHILEGYKVADKMKEHGVAASTFSDWWAYKYEVIDAIPYNGAILNNMGVVTGFNSDDAEMARRLNQEAAKAIKYGGVSEEDAWKFVTLNPAKMLHIDNRVGSIKVGKDADVVLWSENPLSVYAKTEKTFIDGICFFDRDNDIKLREEIKKEKNRLIQKTLSAADKGEKTQKVKPKEDRLYHCDTVGE